MKKRSFFTAIVCLILCCFCFAGCDITINPPSSPSNPSTPSNPSNPSDSTSSDDDGTGDYSEGFLTSDRIGLDDWKGSVINVKYYNQGGDVEDGGRCEVLFGDCNVNTLHFIGYDNSLEIYEKDGVVYKKQIDKGSTTYDYTIGSYLSWDVINVLKSYVNLIYENNYPYTVKKSDKTSGAYNLIFKITESSSSYVKFTMSYNASDELTKLTSEMISSGSLSARIEYTEFEDSIVEPSWVTANMYSTVTDVETSVDFLEGELAIPAIDKWDSTKIETYEVVGKGATNRTSIFINNQNQLYKEETKSDDSRVFTYQPNVLDAYCFNVNSKGVKSYDKGSVMTYSESNYLKKIAQKLKDEKVSVTFKTRMFNNITECRDVIMQFSLSDGDYTIVMQTNNNIGVIKYMVEVRQSNKLVKKSTYAWSSDRVEEPAWFNASNYGA